MKTRDYIFIMFSFLAMIAALMIYQQRKLSEIVIENNKDTIHHVINPSYNKFESVYPEIDVTATVYHAVEEQCNEQHLVTASGLAIRSTEMAYKHRYIAVSRDLLKYFPYGTVVYVEGTEHYDGIYIVADTMNKRFRKYIDILISPGMPVEKTKNVRISKVKSNFSKN